MVRRLVLSLVGVIVVVLGLLVGNLVAGNVPSLGLDLQGGASVTLQPEGSYDAKALDVAVSIIRSRVDSIGVAEPEIIRQGDTVVVNLPGVEDQQRALDIIGKQGQCCCVLCCKQAPSTQLPKQRFPVQRLFRVVQHRLLIPHCQRQVAQVVLVELQPHQFL